MGWKYRGVPLQGKERGKDDLVLVKTGKPCNKSHAKENPIPARTAGDALHGRHSGRLKWRYQAAVIASEKPSAAAALTARRLEAELAEANARIAELRASAETDFLLDILNCRGFTRGLTRAVAFIGRHGATLALIVFDVDHLKAINDAFGHAAGGAS